MNQQFRKFLNQIAANEKEKRQIPCLKELEREALRRDFVKDNSLRSGSFSLSSRVCQNEKLRILNYLISYLQSNKR